MPLTRVLLPLTTSDGVLALVLRWPRMRSGPSSGRLVADVVVTTLALSALACGLLVLAQRLPW